MTQVDDREDGVLVERLHVQEKILKALDGIKMALWVLIVLVAFAVFLWIS